MANKKVKVATVTAVITCNMEDLLAVISSLKEIEWNDNSVEIQDVITKSEERS